MDFLHATIPVVRRDIVLGRYLSSAFVQILIALVTYLPYLVYLLTFIVSFYVGSRGWGAVLDDPALFCAAALGVALAVYAASFLLACRFYEKRDL